MRYGRDWRSECDIGIEAIWAVRTDDNFSKTGSSYSKNRSNTHKTCDPPYNAQ